MLYTEPPRSHSSKTAENADLTSHKGEQNVNPNLTANLLADRELRAEIHAQQLAAVREKLASAQQLLVDAGELMSKIDGSFFEIDSAIADALYHCGEAIHQIDHHPQPDA
jgi:hypothetical protein